MVPLRDDNPTVLVPYVTAGLILLNVLVFTYQLTLSPEQLEAFLQVYAVIPRELTADLNGYMSSQSFPEPLTLLTSQFIHGGFLHVGGNMLFLWIFGNNIEDRLGHFKFLFFYLTCGLLAGLCQWYVAPFSTLPSLGASGAVAGVMGAYILRFPEARVLTLVPLGIVLVPLRIPAIFFLGFWFLQQALYGFASLSVPSNIGMESGGIAYWAHAGGFIVGAILGPMLGLFNRDRQ